MDLAVANLGRNTACAMYGPGPIRLYHGEWSTPGRVEVLEAWQREGTWLPIRNRTQLTVGLPDLPARFPTHEAFARADVPRVLGEAAARASFLEAVEVDSGVFLNRTNRFEWRPFPREAEWSPASSVHVADVDGDGFEDVFLSQNRSDLLPEYSRDDAGSGLWLRGQGDGRFEAFDPTVSGIRIDGEQQAAALADFDHDRRIDVVVSQINGPTTLWANRRARPACGWYSKVRRPIPRPSGPRCVCGSPTAGAARCGPSRAAAGSARRTRPRCCSACRPRRRSLACGSDGPEVASRWCRCAPTRPRCGSAGRSPEALDFDRRSPNAGLNEPRWLGTVPSWHSPRCPTSRSVP